VQNLDGGMPEGTDGLLLKTPLDAIKARIRFETKSPFLDETFDVAISIFSYGGVLIAYGFNGGVAASGV